MIIVYASRTGNIKRFVSRISEYQTIPISEYTDEMGKFVLITYTNGFGAVPQEVQEFLGKHNHNLVGVSASGNKNWGKDLFAKSGDKISQQYNIPLLHKFELSGTDNDLMIFLERVKGLHD